MIKMKKIILISIISCVILLAGCWNKWENNSENNSDNWEWMWFYYPDRYDIWNSSLRVIEKWFNSLEECRNWARREGYNRGDDYDYECWYKCKPSGSLYMCEKTLD
jgi:hypothetical protein